MNIRLHIGRVMLDEALLAGERAADVRVALERELARLLAAPQAVGTLCAIGTVDSLPPVTLPAARRPHDRLGVRIAAAVGDGLGAGLSAPARGPHASTAAFGEE
ncbi:MAG: hypothetical protein ACRESG_09360 [Gammaproteobacteria bacterium]